MDILENMEAAAEQWAIENVRGDEAICSCGYLFKLSEGETVSANPYALPVCPYCFERWCWEQRMKKPLELVRMEQFGECLAACVATIAGTSILDVRTHCRFRFHTDFKCYTLPTNEAIRYLAMHLVQYGCTIGKLKFDKVPERSDYIEVQIELKALAILTVESKVAAGAFHAVVWDPMRQMILDPAEEKPQPLTDYKIIDWTVCQFIVETE